MYHVAYLNRGVVGCRRVVELGQVTARWWCVFKRERAYSRRVGQFRPRLEVDDRLRSMTRNDSIIVFVFSNASWIR